MEHYFKNPNVDVLQKVYVAVNAMDTKIPELTNVERRILRYAETRNIFRHKLFTESFDRINAEPKERTRRRTFIDILTKKKIREKRGNKDQKVHETFIQYEEVKIPIKIPLTMNSEEVGDVLEQSSIPA